MRSKFLKFVSGILGLLLLVGVVKHFYHNTLVCDDFLGGRLPMGALRGMQCSCKGWKMYLKHDSPSDGRDLSLCLGIISERRFVK